MTLQGIRDCICGYFNSQAEFEGCPFIQVPTNQPAPVGNYMAVGVEGVEQQGNRMTPPPGENGEYGFFDVATLYFTEVEGDGDNLRHALQHLQCPEFIAAAKTAGFTVWDPSAIIRLDSYDGDFFIRQWRASFRVNFGESRKAALPKIDTVDFTLTGE